ncbi:MAG: histidine phosphatase family protein [Burkholderiaceae bacterium]
MATTSWPAQVWITRHGQSAGNVARDEAERLGAPTIDIADRDVDVPLSALGCRQAQALGHWLRDLPAERRPNVVLSSPYMRAIATAEHMLDAAKVTKTDIYFSIDERLREKEFGILDRLTRFGIQQRFPDLDAQRQHVGKFYFRPPGGESWCDVILRLRGMLDTLKNDYPEQRVMVVAHQVIVNCFRYLVEGMTEAEILAIDRVSDVPNCAVTSYKFDPGAAVNGKLVLESANFVQPLLQEGTSITSREDMPKAAR